MRECIFRKRYTTLHGHTYLLHGFVGVLSETVVSGLMNKFRRSHWTRVR